MKTRAEIVEAGLKLLSSYAPTPINDETASIPVDAGLIHYELIVGQELESYLYQFSLKVRALNNSIEPEELQPLADFETYSYFAKPENSGIIIGAVDASQVQPTLSIISRKGKNFIRTFNHQLYGDYIQLPKTDDPLYLIYVNSDPEPSSMSTTFKNGIVFGIASRFLITYKDQRRTRMEFIKQMEMSFKKARTFDNYAFNKGYKKVDTLDEILQGGGTDGRAFTDESAYATYEYN